MKKILLASFLMLLSLNAIAEDKFSWKGFYGSFLIGDTFGDISEGNSKISYDPSPLNFLGYGEGSKSMSSFSGSLKFGYNLQIENNIYGFEASSSLNKHGSTHPMIVAYSNLDGSSYDNAYDQYAPLIVKTKINNYETLSLRYGHIFNENTMLFVLGGAAIAEVERQATQTGDTNWFDIAYTTSNHSNETGYVVGFGIEHKLTSHFALRANYEYVDLGTKNMIYKGPNTLDTVTINQSYKIDFSNLSLGLSYQF